MAFQIKLAKLLEKRIAFLNVLKNIVFKTNLWLRLWAYRDLNPGPLAVLVVPAVAI